MPLRNTAQDKAAAPVTKALVIPMTTVKDPADIAAQIVGIMGTKDNVVAGQPATRWDHVIHVLTLIPIARPAAQTGAVAIRKQQERRAAPTENATARAPVSSQHPHLLLTVFQSKEHGAEELSSAVLLQTSMPVRQSPIDV
jgi:hypothetical protein